MATPEFTPAELAAEEWRPVLGYEGLYEVSSLGRIKQIARMRRRRCGRILRPLVSKRGYPTVKLSDPVRGSQPRTVVHRIVMAAFVGPSQLDVNHISGIKTDNRLTNLEYCTRAANLSHAHRSGLMRRGERHHLSKLTDDDVREIKRLLRDGVRQSDIAIRFHVGGPNISQINRGFSWRHIK